MTKKKKQTFIIIPKHACNETSQTIELNTLQTHPNVYSSYKYFHNNGDY